MSPAGLVVRAANAADLPAITAIYAHHVRHGLASFEEQPPDEDEMRRRWDDVVSRGLPWLVAVAAGRVCGYAYAAPYRLRSGYRYTLEDSIYVAPETHRRGVGRALLEALIARCTALGYRQIIAVIGDSANVASIALHEGLGFRHAGVLPATGYKFKRWVDCVLMQRELGEGAATPPAA